MKRLSGVLIAALLLLVAAACGGETSGDTTDPATTVPPVTATSTTTAPTSATSAPAESTAPTSSLAVTTTTEEGTTNGEVMTFEVIGLDEAFSTTKIEIPAGETVTIVFNNKDDSGEPHNFHVRTPDNDWFTTIAEAPDVQELTFSIATPGEYEYFCDTHPQTMTGVLVVSES